MINNQDDLLGDTPIYVYTRAQALDDGELVDVSELAKQCSFRIPVAVTHAVWARHIEWTDEDTNRQTIQNINGRLWDVLWMLRLSISKHKSACSILYKLKNVPRDGKTKKAKFIQLRAIVSAGDTNEPVITIMLPDED